MKTIDVELALMRYLKFNKNLVVPNITDISMIIKFEVDMLMLTQSGYATGVEIKVSKSDLKNDLKKIQWCDLSESYMGKNGFERYFGKFKYFYYCIPSNLVEDTKNQIPEWCGILEAYNDNCPRIRVVRESKLLFKYKWTNEEILKIAKLGAMRINPLKQKIVKLTQYYQLYKQLKNK